MRIAITGATGFIGRRLRGLWQDGDHRLVGLARGRLDGNDCEVVRGDLADDEAIGRLVDGADLVVHLAGLVRAVDPDDFDRVNVEGTRRVASKVAQAAGRLLLVSSLAARHPRCSRYANSKWQSELAASAELATPDLTILRPPAVYGPGDAVTMPIFRQIEAGWLWIPSAPQARFSMIYVDDLVDLIGQLLRADAIDAPIEPDDGFPGGYDWPAIAAMGARITQRRVRLTRLPRWPIAPIASVSDRLASILNRPMLISSDKLGELYHENWVANGYRSDDWTPRFDFATGAARTLDWYRRTNWMKNACMQAKAGAIS